MHFITSINITNIILTNHFLRASNGSSKSWVVSNLRTTLGFDAATEGEVLVKPNTANNGILYLNKLFTKIVKEVLYSSKKN